MKNLPPAVRRKAIEIANALLKERYPELHLKAFTATETSAFGFRIF